MAVDFERRYKPDDNHDKQNLGILSLTHPDAVNTDPEELSVVHLINFLLPQFFPNSSDTRYDEEN